jgi:hypothetical protein
MPQFWPGGAHLRSAVFLSSAVDWPAPAEKLFISGCAAGSGGGGGHTAATGGGGGGGSPGWAAQMVPFAAVKGAPLQITISSGTAGAAPGAAPTAPGLTTVSGLLDAPELGGMRLTAGTSLPSAGTATNGGNGGGVSGWLAQATGPTGAGIQGGTANFAIAGNAITVCGGCTGAGPSSNAQPSTARNFFTAQLGGNATGTQGGGGPGGYGPYGRPGAGGNGGAPGADATGYGCGGGGGGCQAAGGNGSPGFIEICWFE